MLCGLLAHSLVFVFVYIAGVRATRKGWEDERGVVEGLAHFCALLLNATSGVLHNDTPANGTTALAGMLHTDTVATVRAGGNASVTQYLTWSMNA